MSLFHESVTRTPPLALPSYTAIFDKFPENSLDLPCGGWSFQAPTNLLLRSGTRSMNATLADLGGRVLAVDDLPDLGRVDFRTGTFAAKVHGVVLDANRPIGAVRNRTLTGDLSTVLNGLVEVCSDTDRIGHVDAPGMVLDGFTLA
jgi:predicted Zn-dependent protease